MTWDLRGLSVSAGIKEGGPEKFGLWWFSSVYQRDRDGEVG